MGRFGAEVRIECSAGFALNVEIAGDGPALVMLHGFTGSARSWGVFGDLLARSFTTVRLDIVGHGGSDSPASIDHYQMPLAVVDLLDAADRTGFPEASWLGYSMGGRTALHVAAARPGAVRRLVLVGASPGIAEAEERAARREADEALARRIEVEGIEAFTDYWEAIPLFASQRRLPADVRARIRAGRLACDRTGLANSLRGMGAGAQEPLHHRLHELTVPTLLLAGSDDTKYTEIGAAMAGVLPAGRFVAVPGAGHAAQVEAPAFCAETITAFLREGDQ